MLKAAGSPVEPVRGAGVPTPPAAQEGRAGPSGHSLYRLTWANCPEAESKAPSCQPSLSSRQVLSSEAPSSVTAPL